MKDQDDPLVIHVEAEGYYLGKRVGDFIARGTDRQQTATGETMHAAVRSLLARCRRPDDAFRVKVQEETHVSAENLIGLLAVLEETYGDDRDDYPWMLDLSGCDLAWIDVSPAALNALAVPAELRVHETSGINLWGIQLTRAELVHAQLQGARLWGARCEGASLRHVQLQNARVDFADLEGADLRGADLSGVDLRGVSSLIGTRWNGTRLENTRLYRRQLGSLGDEEAIPSGDVLTGYSEAMEAYQALKVNFASHGNYEDAAWAYFKEQQMEKASYFPTTAGMNVLWFHLRGQVPGPRRPAPGSRSQFLLRSAWLRLRLFLRLAPFDSVEMDRPRWFRTWLYELLTGYGERPWRPVLWGLVTIFAFFFAYWGAGNIATGDPSVNPAPTHSFDAALTHSVAAFATIGFNTLEPVGWGARLLTAVESMMGIGFFALFIYTLGNRMSRS